jgi:hypothetical protein
VDSTGIELIEEVLCLSTKKTFNGGFIRRLGPEDCATCSVHYESSRSRKAKETSPEKAPLVY